MTMTEIDTDLVERESPWIHRYTSGAPARARLVCFPFAGGSASYYFPFANQLAPDIEVLAVQYPGRHERRREPCLEDMGEIVERSHEALRDWLGLPMVLFGHSMGAVVAFEVARRLSDVDRCAPARLFVSGRRAPTRQREDDLHRRDDAGLLAELRRTGGTDSTFLDDEELAALILPTVRSDYTAIETYRYEPGPPLSCSITALVGDADDHVTVDEAAAWAEHTSGGFALYVLAGEHFFLTRHRVAVAEWIRAALDGCEPSPRG
jgi:surfactin synthase thioesterase subunit